MIVRDNAQIIGRCLQSIAPYVQEVVIVDTGSEDSTKEQIRAVVPDARIYDFNHLTHPESFLLDATETWNGEIPGPFSGKYMLANFGAARQFGWQRITGEYGIWLDSDDTVQGAERIPEILNDMRSNNADTALLNYDYSTDGFGNVNMKLTRERISRRTFNAYWKQPVHELLVPRDGMGTVGRFYDSANIRHHRSEYGLPTVFHHRNLKILFKWLERDGGAQVIDPRLLFYLAMEERFQWPDRAIEHFNVYCQRSGWDEERAAAHVLCGSIHEHFNRHQEAFAEFCQAMIEFPPSPDGLFGCARVAYAKQDWGKVIDYTERGFAVANGKHDRPVQLMWNPMDRDYRPHVFYSAALINTGQNERALVSCESALKLVPDDPHLKGNKIVAQNNLKAAQNRAASGESLNGKIPVKFHKDFSFDSPAVEVATDIAVAWTLQGLWRQLIDESPASALALLDSLPFKLRTQTRVLEARAFTIARLGGAPAAQVAPVEHAQPAQAADPRTMPMADPQPPFAGPPVPSPMPPSIAVPLIRKAFALDIICWTGPGWEEWTPRTPDTIGLGGSEIAAICLMRELAKRGHRVRVIGHPPHGQEGTYDDVEYIRFERTGEIATNSKPDILIASRAPQACLDFKARANFIWAHDIHVGDATGRNMEGIMRADHIFALTGWHKQHLLQTYPFLAPDTVLVTRNGIDVKRFAAEPVKQGNRLIWASTPHRGIDRAIDFLGRVRMEVPDAELHVYYGFGTWETIARQRATQDLPTIERYKRMLTTTPGVVFHDRVNQIELARAYLASKVWFYPTWFDETSCISAMEAQAAGAVPVTTGRAALNETVKHGVLLNPPDSSPEYAGTFVKTVVELLKNEEHRRQIADQGRKWALANLGWDRVAVEWETIFQQTLGRKAQRPLSVPAFGSEL